MSIGNAPPPSPVLPLAPLEYDVQYLNNLVRLLTYYIQQQDNQNQISTGGTGTVTSVGLTLPSIFSVAGSPVTGSGTLAGTLVSEGAHTVFAGPTSGTAAPTFRSLVASDLPAVTNLAGGSSGVVPYQSATGTTAFTSAGTTGQVLQSNGSAAPTWVTPTSGSSTVINVADYGASPSASASTNTAAIQAAINAAPSQGATIVFPPSDNIYLINGTINVNKQKITIDGQGVYLRQTSNVTCFYVTAWFCNIVNILIDGTGTTFSASTYAIDTGYLLPPEQAAQNFKIYNVTIQNVGSGIRLRSAFFWVTNCYIGDLLVNQGIGININSQTSAGQTYEDIIGFISDTVVIGNVGDTGHAYACIRWTSGHALQISNCELIGALVCLELSPVISAVAHTNDGLLSMKCVNTYFDSPGSSAVIFKANPNSTSTGYLPIDFISFVGCWFGNVANYYGIYVEPNCVVRGLILSGCEVYGAVSGFVFGSNCTLKAINISGCNISCTTTGIDIGSNCANISINSNYIGVSNPGSGTPLFPVYFNSGANNIVMTGNRLNTNYGGGAPTTSVLANNLVAA